MDDRPIMTFRSLRVEWEMFYWPLKQAVRSWRYRLWSEAELRAVIASNDSTIGEGVNALEELTRREELRLENQT